MSIKKIYILIPLKKLPEEPKDSNCSQLAIENIVEKNTPPILDSPKLISKKVLPPISPKSDHLKVSTNTSTSEPECI